MVVFTEENKKAAGKRSRLFSAYLSNWYSRSELPVNRKEKQANQKLCITEESMKSP